MQVVSVSAVLDNIDAQRCEQTYEAERKLAPVFQLEEELQRRMDDECSFVCRLRDGFWLFDGRS